MSPFAPFTVLCPAKVNLFLAVGPLDAVGYHPLRTVFQAVGLFDELRVEPGDGRHVFTCDTPVEGENSVQKALRLADELVTLPPLRLHLTKRIPSEAGLGGGSSDAAGLLRAVARIVGPAAKPEDLHHLATVVGADVPFFLVGGLARAEGYGERLTPLPDPPEEWLTVVKPAVACPTGPAFRRLDAMTYPWRDFPASDELYNDFERVAPCESLEAIERLLVFGARDAGLTGSGSAVFARFGPNAQAAEAAAHRARDERLGDAWAIPTVSREHTLICT